jgi:hypothetical protein
MLRLSFAFSLSNLDVWVNANITWNILHFFLIYRVGECERFLHFQMVPWRGMEWSTGRAYTLLSCSHKFIQSCSQLAQCATSGNVCSFEVLTAVNMKFTFFLRFDSIIFFSPEESRSRCLHQITLRFLSVDHDLDNCFSSTESTGRSRSFRKLCWIWGLKAVPVKCTICVMWYRIAWK